MSSKEEQPVEAKELTEEEKQRYISLSPLLPTATTTILQILLVVDK